MLGTVKSVALNETQPADGKPQVTRRALVLDQFPGAALFSDAQWAGLRRTFGLTGRQLQMARLICEGCTYEGIAVRTGLSINTVRMHIRELFSRLDVHDRVSVVVRLVLAERIVCAPRRPSASA